LPNRTTLVTGQWERSHTVGWSGGRALSAAQWADTLPMALKRAGYFTGLIGKSNIHGVRPQDMGYFCATDYVVLNFYPKTYAHVAPLFRGARAETQIEVLGEAADDFLGADEGFHARSADPNRRFFGRRPKDKPFFLYLCFNVPHTGGTGTMKQLPTDDALYRTVYRDQLNAMPLVPGYVAQKDVTTPKIPLDVYNGKQIASYDYRLTPDALREQQVRICQTVTGVDRLLGRLREQLRELGLAGNTLIVYSADNGILHGEYGYGGKCLLYEPAIHVPLIIHDPRPGAPRGKRVREALAVSPDVAPTSLDLCGLTPPPRMQGRSLTPLMRDANAPWREDFFCESHILFQSYPITQGVRSQRWKYIRYWPLRPVPKDYREILNLGLNGEPLAYEELYDLRNDPHEQVNLAGAAEHRAIIERLRTRCVELQRESLGRQPGDPLPSDSMADWRKATETFDRALKNDPGM
jgi:arylsulfatase A-like enzyme